MRKTFALAALTLGALGVTAGAANADPMATAPVIDDNEHHIIQDGGLINIGVQDVLTNADILTNVLTGGINGNDVL